MTLFHLFGFRIKADASWIILAVLITWSFADSVFPSRIENIPQVAYWIMGVSAAVGLFASIVFHEIGHALAARHYGIPIKDITLFIFGGLAHLEGEPKTPKSEFVMAIMGPVVSVVLGAGLLFGSRFLEDATGTTPLSVIMNQLGWINAILALFNMVPAFPLDGGRILRALLWGWRGNLRWATRIASSLGVGFGTFLLVLGVVSFISGNLVGGLWWCLIGMFVRSASKMSYQQLMVRRALEGEPIRKFMIDDPVVVSPGISLEELVEKFVYVYHHKFYPVTAGDRLVGCVHAREVKTIPREDWRSHTVSDIMYELTPENTADVNEDAMKVLGRMSGSGNSRLLVTEGGDLRGLVALKDLLRFLSLKMDLESGKSGKES
jgi:Zn-dependent protease